MKRVIVALKLEGLEATSQLHSKLIQAVREQLCQASSRVVDVRIGRKRVEVDVFTDNAQEVVRVLSCWAPLEYVRDIESLEEFSEAELVSFAVALFNDERFWEAHEALEQVWRSKTGEEREVLSGLIKLSAAYVHAQKGRLERFFGLLRSALNHLSQWTYGEYHGIDIEALRRDLESLLKGGVLRFVKIPV